MSNRRVVDLGVASTIDDTDYMHIIQNRSDNKTKFSVLKQKTTEAAQPIVDDMQENLTYTITLSDSVSDLYFGELASDPVSDMVVGSTYYNTTSNILYVYDGFVWTPAISEAVINEYSFNGDGAQKNFTLHSPPTSKENLLITIGGLLIDATKYSVSGSVLSFNTAPAIGVGNISIKDISSLEALQDGYNTSFDNSATTLNSNNAQSAIDEMDSLLDSVGGVDGYPTGSIISVVDTYDKENWLECDGSRVSEAQYPALFALIGWNPPSVEAGSGVEFNQSGFNRETQQTISLSSISNIPPNNAGWNGTATAMCRGFVYCWGGSASSGTYSNQVWSNEIQPDGTLSDTSIQRANLPFSSRFHSPVGTRNYIYSVGGFVSSSARSNIYKAAIEEDGSYSAWTSAGTLPIAKFNTGNIFVGDKFYSFGGTNNSQTNTKDVYIADVDQNGDISNFVKIGDLNYSVGCYNVLKVRNTFYIATPNLSGFLYGLELSDTSIISHHEIPTLSGFVVASAFSTDTKLYVVLTGSGFAAKVMSGEFDSEGMVSSFVEEQDIPSNDLQLGTVVITSSKIYINQLKKGSFVFEGDYLGGHNNYSYPIDYYSPVRVGDEFYLPNVKPIGEKLKSIIKT